MIAANQWPMSMATRHERQKVGIAQKIAVLHIVRPLIDRGRADSKTNDR